MATSIEQISAMNAYIDFCKALDLRNWTYDKDDGELKIVVSARGEDLPIDLVIFFDVNYQIVRLYSRLPFEMDESKRVEGSIATNAINYDLANGSFDYDVFNGCIMFRLTQSFRDSYISSEIYSYMIDVACYTIDKYNDMLFMLNKNMITLERFLEIL